MRREKMMRQSYLCLPAIVLVISLFSACSGSDGGASSGSNPDVANTDQSGSVRNSPSTPTSTGAGDTLNIIAGSELKDLEPLLPQIREKTGVQINFQYSGTLDGIDRIQKGEAFDAAWFSHAKYLALNDTGHRVKTEEKTMLSPVVLGLKQTKARELGWTGGSVTWKDIALKAGSGQLTFAMTNPASSNSGFSAVIGVASASAGNPDDLQASKVDPKMMSRFFSGQKLTAGSSGWLTESFVRDQDKLDGIINYESSLLALNQGGQLKEPLTLIYPKEGIITADYPLILLDESKRTSYDKVVNFIKSADFQRTIMEKTFRRPINPDVPLSSDFPKTLLVELPFPNRLSTINDILSRFLNDNRIPAHSFFVLDVSGSMQGPRLSQVQEALNVLAGGDASLTGRFARFQNREKMTMISFSSAINPPVNFEMHSRDDPHTLAAVRKYVSDLRAGGDTAIYSAVETAIRMALQAQHDDTSRYSSIVLMTDGENNHGDSAQDLQRYYEGLPPAARVKVFPILFGEGNPDELKKLAELTGGRLFDGKQESLASVFKQIRGYQ